MAPSIQTQHVVAVTIPTIAVIFLTYLWYKKRSNSITRGRNDPGGGGGISRKRARHRSNMVSTMPNAVVPNSGEQEMSEVMKSAMQKAIRDLETASPIQEICSDSEDNVVASSIENLSSETTMILSSCAKAPLENNDIDMNACSRVEENNNESGKAFDKNDSSNVDAYDSRCDSFDKDPTPAAALVAEKASQSDNTTQWSEIVDSEEEKVFTDKNKPNNDNRCFSIDSQQGERKNNVKNCHENAAKCAESANLEVAMQKLESMRMIDKPKRKSGSITIKRHAVSKEISTIQGFGEANVVASSSSVRSKLPSSLASQLTSPSSKLKKRKSKKKTKNTDCEENVLSCPSQDETTSTVNVTNSCDSQIDFDFAERTNIDVKSAFKICSPDEKVLRSAEDDNIRCNLNKTDGHNRKVIEHHQANCDNERDSANHSPVDTMLDSQLVQFSDAHSEGSSDSGKGCSEGAASPTPQTPVNSGSDSGDQNVLLLYQFVIPQEHVGKLIGKHGQFINGIKSNSNTKIYIKKHPTSFKKKICALEGSQHEINKALELIRTRFPEESYPDITLEEFPLSLPIPCPLRSELFQLDLVEGVNNDVVISSVVSAGHLFLQQPMHPTYQSLTLLNLSMNQVYSSPEAPVVLKPIKDNIVAAPAMDGWYRAQIVSVDEEMEECDVRFLDYGGYLSLSTSCLRAVRADFLTLPFQAVECYLANVAPVNDVWCEDAKLVVQGLTYGHILQAQVYDYTADGIPLILLYAVHGSQVILINQELIARGYAYSTSPNEVAQSEEYYVFS